MAKLVRQCKPAREVKAREVKARAKKTSLSRPMPSRNQARVSRRHVDLCCIAVYMETRGDWFAIPVTSPPAHG